MNFWIYAIAILINLGLTWLLGDRLGSKRQIGFWWSVFFCLTLSVIIGFIIIICSKPSDHKNPDPSNFKKSIGLFLITIIGIAILGAVFGSSKDMGSNHLDIIPTIGWFFFGYYLYKRGQGERFDEGYENSYAISDLTDRNR